MWGRQPVGPFQPEHGWHAYAGVRPQSRPTYSIWSMPPAYRTFQAVYKALSSGGDPKLSTFFGVMKALGVKLSVAPMAG